jgi:hypothetical protein
MKKDILEKFNHDIYILKSINEEYFIYDINNKLLFYAVIAQTLFPPNDIKLYTNEQMDTELLHIKTTQKHSYYKTFTIKDSSDKKIIGYAQLSSYKSVFIDQWKILDPDKKEIGFIKEESNLFSVLRYMISMFLPQKFYIVIGGEKVSFFEQTFNPFSIKMKLDFSLDKRNILDKKLGIAFAILCTIDTKHGDGSGGDA